MKKRNIKVGIYNGLCVLSITIALFTSGARLMNPIFDAHAYMALVISGVAFQRIGVIRNVPCTIIATVFNSIGVLYILLSIPLQYQYIPYTIIANIALCVVVFIISIKQKNSPEPKLPVPPFRNKN